MPFVQNFFTTLSRNAAGAFTHGIFIAQGFEISQKTTPRQRNWNYEQGVFWGALSSVDIPHKVVGVAQSLSIASDAEIVVGEFHCVMSNDQASFANSYDQNIIKMGVGDRHVHRLPRTQMKLCRGGTCFSFHLIAQCCQMCDVHEQFD